MKPIEALKIPNVSYKMYAWEIAFLIIALSLPLASWLIWNSGDMLSRSGSLVVFCSVLAEFSLLHKANVKHIRNAQRVLQKVEPMTFSTPATRITIASLLIALLGTFLWGYGDIFVS